MSDTFETLVNSVKDPTIKANLENLFPDDVEAARFAVVVDGLLRSKFMDLNSKLDKLTQGQSNIKTMLIVMAKEMNIDLEAALKKHREEMNKKK